MRAQDAVDWAAVITKVKSAIVAIKVTCVRAFEDRICCCIFECFIVCVNICRYSLVNN